MEGIIFFWFMWMIWVYVTFLMEKTPFRTELAFWILLTIISSNYQINILGEEVNVAIIALLLYGYYRIGKIRIRLFFYCIIGSGALSLAYTCYFMLAIYDPVWVIFDLKWMLSLSMVLFSFLLFKDPIIRVASLIVGLCHGELLYTLVILKLNPTKVIGDFYFLDIFAVSIFICTSWYVFEQIVQRWNEQLQRILQEKKHVYRP